MTQQTAGIEDVSLIAMAKKDTNKRLIPRIKLPGLGLIASERRLLLAAMDVLCLWLALAAAIIWRTDWDRIGAGHLFWGNPSWFITLLLLWLPVGATLDVFNLALAASAPHSVAAGGAATLITVFIYQFIPYFTPPLGPRGVIFTFGAMALLLVCAWRGFYALLFVQPNFQQRGLVLGAGAAGRALAAMLGHVPAVGNPFRGTGYQIVGFLDDDPAKQGTVVDGIPVLGGSGRLPGLAVELGADEVVLAITQRHTMLEQSFEAILACRERGIRVTTMPSLCERLLGRIPVQHVGRDLYAVLPDQGPTQRLFMAAKWVVDRIAGLVGLLALALVAPLVALANALWSPGPLFFRQSRVGKGGRIFTVLKFRTMIPDAERLTGAVWCSEADPRITRAGRLLRKTRLDELPQVVNVLRGEMSLIGPRPERPEFVAQLAEQIPFYRARHAVLPGLTGWAQVRYGYGDSVDDARIKLEHDLYYVKHAGFYLDVLILLKTPSVIFGLKGQ